MAEPIRVAVIGSRGAPASHGGVERHVEELYARLAARGCRPTVFARRAYIEPMRDKIEWIRYPRLGLYRGMRIEAARAPSAKGLEAFVHCLASTLRASLSRQYDILHFHALGPAAFARIPLALGRRVAATVHSLDWQREKWGAAGRAFIRFGERTAGRRIGHLVCVSRDLQRHMLETWGREAEFIPNGVPAAEPLRAATVGEWNLRAGEYIVFVGRLTPEKGVHTLIEAYESTDARARLAIVGGSSQTDDYVRRLEAMSGPRVVFAGFAYGDDLNRLISNARFVVNPSTLEGLPIAVLEAHALGKHALASDIPAHREIVRDPRWLFPPGDAPALAARLRERLAEPIEERDAALVERVRAEYDWDKAAEKTLAMYARMMAEAK